MGLTQRRVSKDGQVHFTGRSFYLGNLFDNVDEMSRGHSLRQKGTVDGSQDVLPLVCFFNLSLIFPTFKPIPITSSSRAVEQSILSRTMFKFLILFIFFSTFENALSSPFAHTLESRDDQTNPSLIPTINASIFDHAGNDLTSSFQVMLYNEPEVSNMSSLSGRGLATTTLSRPISGCAGLETRGAQFVRSWCTAKDNGGSMQTYSYQCKVNGGGGGGAGGSGSTISIPQTHNRNGRCDDEEICVDAKGGGKRKGGRMAFCVSKQSFVRYVLRGRYADAEPRLNLAGREVAALFSQSDGATPMEVETLDIEAGSTSTSSTGGQVAAPGIPGQSIQCRDCIELNTDILAAKTDFLKTEAKLLTTGATATMGIMWLAIMSG